MGTQRPSTYIDTQRSGICRAFKSATELTSGLHSFNVNAFNTKWETDEMLIRKTPPSSLLKRSSILASSAAMAVLASPAQAGTVDLGDGVEAVWSLGASFTSGTRMAAPDPNMIGVGDGGQASAATHSHTKNFQKHDSMTQLGRVIGDVNIRKGDTGMMLRGKAWDNWLYSHGDQDFGAPSNGFRPGTRLSDSQFDTNLSKFRGFELLDAYAYTSFNFGESAQMKVRFGQHVVNFGESIFIPGVNQYQALDITALRQPGTQLKEALLPVPQISANLGMGDGLSFEGFYQLGWRRSAIDGCGTYWSPANALNCVNGSILVGGDGTSEANWNGYPHAALGGMPLNYQFSRLGDKKPSSGGQFGLAIKKMVDSLDTEFGAYYVNYTTKLPNLSAVRRQPGQPGSILHPEGSAYALNPGTRDASIYWDYSAKNIKVLGLSASTVLGGWSIGSELSYTQDFPVQINSVDAFYALASGVGPMATQWGAGPRTMVGYERKNKTQLQVSAFRLLPSMLGQPAACSSARPPCNAGAASAIPTPACAMAVALNTAQRHTPRSAANVRQRRPTRKIARTMVTSPAAPGAFAWWPSWSTPTSSPMS